MLIFQVDDGCIINLMVCTSYIHDEVTWSELSITCSNLGVTRNRIFYLIIEIS